MSIYPDKKDGKLTGRFRVEVQGRYQRYRARCNSIGEANSKNTEFMRLAAEGLPPPPCSHNHGGRPRNGVERFCTPEAMVPQLLPSTLFSKARQDVDGALWNGAHEKNCLGMLGTMQELMGDLPLNDVDTRWAMDLRQKLKDERKTTDGTINRYFSCLSAFLKWTIKRGDRTLKELPELAFSKESEGRLRWITEDEEKVLMVQLPERSAKLARLAILTGMRRGELLALTPDQLNGDRITLWGTGTKSGKSRPIPLTPEGEELFKWLVVEGNAPSASNLRNDWDRARKAMGLVDDAEFVFHATRHTFAVRAVEAGVPIRTLQQWMGHETIEMTERYGKVSGKALDSATVLMFGAREAA